MIKRIFSRLLLTSAILLSLTTSHSPLPVSRAAPANQPALPAGLGEVEATWNPVTNTPSFLRGEMPLTVPVESAQADVTGAAVAFLDQYATLFGIVDAQTELVASPGQVDELGLHHVTLQQVYQGVEVYNAVMKVHLNLASGNVIAASSGFVPDIVLPSIMPQTSAEAAVEFAQSFLPSGVLQAEPHLVVFPGYGSSRGAIPAQLAWLVDLYDEGEPARNLYVVDALDGELLDIIEQIHMGKWIHTEQEPPPGDVMPAGVESPDEVEIIGGKVVTDPNLYPWMAGLQYQFLFNLLDSQRCGGTLLYPRWVLTAAHCVVDKDTGQAIASSSLEVALGSLHRNPSDGERIEVLEIIANPDYDPSNLDSDIALLHLKKTSVQQPMVYLATASQTWLEQPQQLATAVGWGESAENGNPASILRHVTIPILDTQNVCNTPPSTAAGRLTNNHLCAGIVGNKMFCHGDSGGPLLVHDRENRWVQIGIVSGYYGGGCVHPNVYGIYTRASQFHAWVISQVAEICESVSEIPLAECQSLALLYHSTNGPDWKNNDGWMHTTTPCTWLGITCSAGHVSEVRLSNNNLQGALPPELANLTRLTILDLSLNEIGGVIPGELSGLSSLKQLSLQESIR